MADVDDARRVAQQLGIDHLVFNFGDDFAEHVVEPYVEAHARGLTPNPCIECNRHLKFARLAERADAARLRRRGHRPPRPGRAAARTARRWRLARGADRAKDQSYVLHMLGQRGPGAARSCRSATMTKAEVRERAAALGLRTAAKADSQDVCFITSSRRPPRRSSAAAPPLHPAVVVDTAGRPVGEVPAVELVTLGQRKGLGLPAAGRPATSWTSTSPGATVTVGSADDLLVAEQRRRTACSWVGRAGRRARSSCSAARTGRRGRRGARARRRRTSVRSAGSEPQRRVAPGQSVVFYDSTDPFVLGGGLAA